MTVRVVCRPDRRDLGEPRVLFPECLANVHVLAMLRAAAMFDAPQLIHFAIGQIQGCLEPSPAERAAAHELFVVCGTGSAVAPMLTGRGTIRDSIDGFQSVTAAVTDVLRKHGSTTAKGSLGNLSLSTIAIRVVTEVIQPVMTRWVPEYESHVAVIVAARPGTSVMECEAEWALAPLCRAELKALKAPLRDFQYLLMRIAGIAADDVLTLPASRVLNRTAVPAAVAPQGAHPRATMVRWLNIHEMIKLGAARRRARHDPPATPVTGPFMPTASFHAGKGEDFVADYVSDLGDGFDPTMAVAWQIGRRAIHLPDDPNEEFPSPPTSLRRAQLLVMGGDQVYPSATAERYAQQTALPYCVAWEPGAEPAEPPTVVAIPGNHDRLGGIEHFDRVFTGNSTFAGRWQTPQSRRYWSIQLPQGWWMWGIDTALDDTIDAAQLAYFTDAATALRRGDRVIVCTPVPMWQLRQNHIEAYVDIRSQLEPIVARQRAGMPLWLSGDSHFFAVYQQLTDPDGEVHITAGGGGAFLQPTHTLSERIPLERGTAEFGLRAAWPTRTDSSRLGAGVGNLADPRNWGWVAGSAVVHLLFAGLAAVRGGAVSQLVSVTGSAPVRAAAWTVATPAVWVFVALLAVAGRYAVKANSRESRLRAAGRTMGAALGAVLALTFVVVAAARRWVDATPPWWLTLLSAVAGGVLTAGVFFGGSKFIHRRIKANDTMVFSGARSTRFKHFLRLRIDQQGDLTVYAIGLDPVGTGWFTAVTKTGVVPPPDPAGPPQLHYIWGRRFPKFEPPAVRVVISISRATKDEPANGPLARLFHDLCVRLIEGGHTVIYGGAPGYDFTAELHEIETRRHADNPNAPRHLLNYVPAYLWGDTDQSPDAPLRAIRVPRESGGGDPTGDPTEVSPTVRIMRDLTSMREKSTVDATVRVCIGGDPQPGTPGTRLAPGVIEEAYISLTRRQPVLIAGGFGGACELLARSLLNTLDAGEVETFADHFHRVDGDAPRAGVAGITGMVSAFGSIARLDNRLTDGENRELLTTSDPAAALELIMRSIDRIARLAPRG